MRVCIPIVRKEDGTSVVYPHLATAPLYMFCDTESGKMEEIKNKYSPFMHGEPDSKLTLKDYDVDTLIVLSMGQSALSHFQKKGIKVLQCLKTTVVENLAALRENKLTEYAIDKE